VSLDLFSWHRRLYFKVETKAHRAKREQLERESPGTWHTFLFWARTCDFVETEAARAQLQQTTPQKNKNKICFLLFFILYREIHFFDISSVNI
jgi:hypothetical protein